MVSSRPQRLSRALLCPCALQAGSRCFALVVVVVLGIGVCVLVGQAADASPTPDDEPTQQQWQQQSELQGAADGQEEEEEEDDGDDDGVEEVGVRASALLTKRSAELQRSDEDLEAAAGTNVLRPLFVYRQQLAYRDRSRAGLRRSGIRPPRF